LNQAEKHLGLKPESLSKHGDYRRPCFAKDVILIFGMVGSALMGVNRLNPENYASFSHAGTRYGGFYYAARAVQVSIVR